MRSIHHRGTPDAPGLVLALDRQPMSECVGIAFRVRDGEDAAVLDYLRERELISSAYL
jgi:cation transport protein ChaC